MRNLRLTFVLVASLMPFATVRAAPADLPETGQTTCYGDTGAIIACTGTGQDGDLMAGVAWPNPRFVAGTGATAGCITDTFTGLMWVAAPSTDLKTWANALTTANNLTRCGFTDWRLPNRKELLSLINYGVSSNANALNALGFSNVREDYPYWSSSSYAGSAASAWVVGMVGGAGRSVKSSNYYVWPVRAGQ